MRLSGLCGGGGAQAGRTGTRLSGAFVVKIVDAFARDVGHRDACGTHKSLNVQSNWDRFGV